MKENQELTAPQPAEDMQADLWSLLGEQLKKYTMGDHSSVPEETARELFRSVLFTVDVHLERQGIQLRRGDAPPPGLSAQELFAAGQRDLAELVEGGKALLERVRATAISVDNRAYRDTLNALPGFFRWYDSRFFAHQIPCDIDYQLFLPVPPEREEGIRYMLAYLRHLLAENLFCSRFAPQSITALLRVQGWEHSQLLLNLFEPVFAVALGLLLAGESPLSLAVEERHRLLLMEMFAAAGPGEGETLLRQGAAQLAKELGLSNPVARYLEAAAASLYPRINAAVAQGSLAGVFPSPVAEEIPAPTVFQDGPAMADKALRALLEELQSCRYLEDKLLLLRQETHSVADLVQLLHAAFWGEELFQVFRSLDNTVLALLLLRLEEDYPRDSIPEWGEALRRFVKELEPGRQWEIHRLGEGLGG